MITTQKFNANLRAFSKLDDTARALFAETVEYVLHHYHTHGNKTPFNQLKSVKIGGIFGDMIKSLKLGKRQKDAPAEAIQSMADMTTAGIFADQEQKKAERAAKRAAKATSTTKPEKLEISNALIVNGELVELSADQADALYVMLMEMQGQQIAEFVPVMLKAA